MSVLSTLREQLSCEPLFSATHIIVAYSGGLDSHVLLHALHSIKQKGEHDFPSREILSVKIRFIIFG